MPPSHALRQLGQCARQVLALYPHGARAQQVHASQCHQVELAPLLYFALHRPPHFHQKCSQGLWRLGMPQLAPKWGRRHFLHLQPYPVPSRHNPHRLPSPPAQCSAARPPAAVLFHAPDCPLQAVRPLYPCVHDRGARTFRDPNRPSRPYAPAPLLPPSCSFHSLGPCRRPLSAAPAPRGMRRQLLVRARAAERCLSAACPPARFPPPRLPLPFGRARNRNNEYAPRMSFSRSPHTSTLPFGRAEPAFPPLRTPLRRTRFHGGLRDHSPPRLFARRRTHLPSAKGTSHVFLSPARDFFDSSWFQIQPNLPAPADPPRRLAVPAERLEDQHPSP